MVGVLYGSFNTGSSGVKYEVLELAALVNDFDHTYASLSGQAV